jgi:hypothetical protein
MGFFSWNCKGCGESVKAPYSLPKKLEWQNEAVLLDNDSFIMVRYDGYGRIDEYEFGLDIEDPELWHRVCWYDACSPKYTGPSTHAEDQGYFYDG